MPVNPARIQAFHLLRRLTAGEEKEPPPLAEVLDRGGLSDADRRLLQALYLGICRQRPRLDDALSRCINRRWSDVQPQVRDVLRIGAYQILEMDRVPARAAVDQSVELCRVVGVARASGFVNGILRRLDRERPDLPPPAGVRGLSIHTGMPEWLVKRHLARYGKEEAIARLIALNTAPHGLSLRANTLRTTTTALRTALEEAGHQVEQGPLVGECLVVDGTPPPRLLPGYREGWFYVQDPAAQWISELLDPRPGERILDGCAAPGGKCTHIAARMENRGEVVALEIDPGRGQRLTDNLQRLGATGVRVVLENAERYDAPPFDRILVDAPCSGLGILRRHPEIRWRRRPEDLVTGGRRQLALLRHLATLVKPAGIIVYTTCSTEPEEGEEVVDAFLATTRGYRLDTGGTFPPPVGAQRPGHLRTQPHLAPVDGFYAARLLRE